MMRLYSYWRSSASYRVRIALNLKGLDHALVPVNLLAQEHKSAEYLEVNPQGLVPSLELDGGAVVNQSLAIIEYLEETHPIPPLLPDDPLQRARARAMALMIGCEIAPLNNSGVMHYLRDEFKIPEEVRGRWMAHWMSKGLAALEEMLLLYGRGGTFAFGEAPGLVECFLVPQLYNARRFGVALDAYPRLLAIDAACAEMEAFKRAHPEAVQE